MLNPRKRTEKSEAIVIKVGSKSEVLGDLHYRSRSMSPKQVKSILKPKQPEPPHEFSRLNEIRKLEAYNQEMQIKYDHNSSLSSGSPSRRKTGSPSFY